MAWDIDIDAGSPAYELAAKKAKTIRAVAGPGSGKSFGVKRRIARLLEEGVHPEEILAITFTRNAAHDLKKDIASLGIDGTEKVHARTLHSHALSILMKADVLVKTNRTPRMVLHHEIKPALKDIDKEEYGDMRNKFKLLRSYLSAWAQLQSDQPGYAKGKVQSNFEKDIVRWLIDHKGMLIGEVIPVALKFFRDNPAHSETRKYKVIIVDEYQDLNKSEQELIRLIRGKAELVVVGDDDQSIYSFKFAHPQGIREMERVHGKFADIRFNECRRCPRDITKIASHLISNNTDRTLGNLVPHAGNPKGEINIIQWPTYDDEVEGISKIIANEIDTTAILPKDVLVLTPRRLIGYKLREGLSNVGKPAQSYFREEAIDNDKLRYAYSLLSVLADDRDNIAYRYLLGFRASDYRAKQYRILSELAKKDKTTVLELLFDIVDGTKKRPKGITSIVNQFIKINDEIQQLQNILVDDPIDGFDKYFSSIEDIHLFDELKAVYEQAVTEIGAEEFVSDEDFREWFNRIFQVMQENIVFPAIPDDDEHIRIMSLHSSKGLHAKLVVLCSMIDDFIPSTPKDEDTNDNHTEEQRRLFYVAMTRCEAADDYAGRLIISSFASINGLDAVRMNIKDSEVGHYKDTTSTSFISQLGPRAPISVLGETLIFDD